MINPHTHNAVLRVPMSAAAYAAGVEGLTRINEKLLQQDPSIPKLYNGKIRYRKEPNDVWRHVVDVASSGFGDCEDLAAYRAAELRNAGDAGAYVGVYKSGPRRYHAVVVHGNGKVEDPSRRLGMGAKTKQQQTRIAKMNGIGLARFCRRRHKVARIGSEGAWSSIGEDPMPNNDRLTFDLYKSGKGWSGIVRVPTMLSSGASKVVTAVTGKTSPSATKAQAAKKAVNMASKLANNKMLQSVMPPQAQAAMAILRSPAGSLVKNAAAKALTKKFW